MKFKPRSRPLTCAVPFLGRESEAVVAATLEAADGVAAGSVRTQTVEDLTLIHIWSKHTHRELLISQNRVIVSEVNP